MRASSALSRLSLLSPIVEKYCCQRSRQRRASALPASSSAAQASARVSISRSMHQKELIGISLFMVIPNMVCQED